MLIAQVIVFIISSISLIICWFFIRPYFRTGEQRKGLLRILLIWGGAAAAFYLVVRFVFMREPEAFSNGVELLENNKEISAEIGTFSSYSYYDKNLSKDIDNPYAFKVELTGSLASVYLSSKVFKDNSGKWHLTEIKQDSLVKAKTD